MKFRSTRGNAPELEFSQALIAGLAPDGGLYVPESLPKIELSALPQDLPELGNRIIGRFAERDPLQGSLREICKGAWNFPVPLRVLSKAPCGFLELFHGPTAAFKDFAARFLAECVSRTKARKRRLVLVATSGDTGGAVAAAFHDKPGIEVVVLYPKGRVSARQEQQLTCWGPQVRAFAVRGSFDDCQAIAKAAFVDLELGAGFELISANSINIGRILPQACYYAWSSIEYQKQTGRLAGFVVPTGNLGNALGAVWAKSMGFPVREVALALNANRPLSDFLQTGRWQPAPSVATIANAMDVGNPSNLERLRALYPDTNALRRVVRARSFNDAEIRDAIQTAQKEWGEILCPHTATAYAFARELKGEDWIVVGTADPAKFDTIVEPLVGRRVPVPAPLQALLSLPAKSQDLEPSLAALKKVLS